MHRRNRFLTSAISLLIVTTFSWLTALSLSNTGLNDWFGGTERLVAFFNTEPDHIAYFLQASQLQDLLFNADALYLPALYQDLVVNGGSYGSWSLTPAPYFFPDMALFFGLNGLLGNTVTTVYSYGISQLVLLSCVIFTGLYAVSTHWYRSLVAAVTATLLLHLALSSGYLPELITLFLSGYHGGATLAGMLSVALLLLWLNSPEKAVFPALLAATVVLATASDLLVVAQFTAPIIMALILMTGLSIQPLHTLLKQLAVLIAATVTGLLLADIITPTPVLAEQINIDSAQLLQNTLRLTDLLQIIATESTVFTITTLVSLTIALAALSKRASRHSAAPAAIFMWLTSLLVVCATLSLAIIFGKTAPRYLIPLFIVPAFWLLPTLAIRLPTRMFLLSQPALALSAIALIFTYAAPSTATLPKHYYPADIACLDNVARRHQLKYGLTDYWQEKRLSLFNQSNLTLVQATPELALRHWINSATVALDKEFGFILNSNYQSADYQFRVPAALKVESETVCGSYQLYHYSDQRLSDWLQNDALLQVSKLIQKQQPITIPAGQLPSAIENSEAGSSRVSRQQRGHLTYGPYIRLPQGNYRFRFLLENEATATTATTASITWELLAAGEQLLSKQLEVASGKSTEIGASFNIQKRHHLQPIEIRLFHHGNGQLLVETLIIDKPL